MKYPIKNFNASMRGAPTKNGTPGSFISILKACLIDGFGETTAVTASIVDGICTIEFNQGEFFQTDSVIWVSGVNVQSINGEQWVTTNTENSCSFKTLESNQTLIGNIKVKYAPVGSWQMPFSATNVAVFRSTHPEASGIYFRFDDTQAKYANARMYQVMSDVNNGQKAFPPLAEDPYIFNKSFYANTTAYNWYIVANEKTVYFSSEFYGGITNPALKNYYTFFNRAFGDYDTEDYVFKNNAFIISNRTSFFANSNYDDTSADLFLYKSIDSYKHFGIFQNPITNIAGSYAHQFAKRNFWLPSNTPSGRGNVVYNQPNRKLLISDICVYLSGNIIGKLPGVIFVGNNIMNASIGSGYNLVGTKIPGIEKLLNRKLMYLGCAGSSSNSSGTTPLDSYGGLGLIDITGPW